MMKICNDKMMQYIVLHVAGTRRGNPKIVRSQFNYLLRSMIMLKLNNRFEIIFNLDGFLELIF